MPLLGNAAMLLSFDVDDAAIAEHDDWHTHEHMPERLAIPGFLRGTRWVATQGTPRYAVLYEVRDLDVLTSAAYLQRLNNPTPWTTAIMAHYRGMARGLCRVLASHGTGMGQLALLLRFQAADDGLTQWLTHDVLPPLAQQRGLAGAHLLRGAALPPMTNEQRIRGADAGVGDALLITGCDEGALDELTATTLAAAKLARCGARGINAARYRAAYTLTAQEAAA